MRKLAVFSGGFAAGIFLAQYVRPPLLPAAAVCLLLGIAAMALPWRWRRPGVVIGAAMALAFGYNWLYIRQVQRPMERLTERESTVSMVLCDYAAKTDYGAKATVELDGFSRGRAVFYGETTLLDLEPGQTITAEVEFRSAAHMEDVDIVTFTSKGVYLLIVEKGGAEYGEGTSGSPRWWPVRLGRAIRVKIQELFPGESAAVFTAILTGDKTAVSQETACDLSEAGLYHIMAVSGMHCGFLLTLVTLLAGRHRRRLVAGVAIPLLIFYAVLVGGSPSVVRACTMMVFLLSAPLFLRESDPPTAFLAALLLILLNNPFAAASLSLQMSFAASAGLLTLTPRLFHLMTGEKRRGKLFQAFAASVSATMGALVFTTPLSEYYFGTLVLVSPLSNLLCLWAASAVFILGLLTVLAGFLWMPLASFFSVVPRVLLGYLLGAAHLLAKIPGHALYDENPYLKYWLAYAYLLFGAAYLLRSKCARKYLTAAVLCGCTLAVTVKLGAMRYRGDLDAFVMDAGQGQCILLSSHGTFALVDCGSANSWKSPGGDAADRLLTMGCRTLDYLILTHYDYDHVSGVRELLARVKVRTLLAPDCPDSDGLREAVFDGAAAQGTEILLVKAGQGLTLGRAGLTVYPPVGESGDNEQGLALLVSLDDLDLLVTGDMGGATERRLLERNELPDIEVLVAGHHGSKYATSQELLESLQPETVCISVGSNSYGHPAPEALERLARQGCTVYRTDLHGEIHLSFNQGA